jgi:opacity protein-like surface antigen
MSYLNSLWRAMTVVAIALLGASTLATAQVPNKPSPKDTTKQQTSTKRIKISKEQTSAGEVALPVTRVVDSTACDVALPPVANPRRDDSIRAEQRVLDSISAMFDRRRIIAEFQRSAAEMRDKAIADSIAREQAAQSALKKHLARGMYFGLAGGANAPQRAIRDGYTGGWNVTVPVGFDATDSPLGIRTDLSIDHMNGTRIHTLAEQTLAACGDVTVWSLNADLKLRFHAPGTGTRTHLYLLGGAGAHKITGGVYGTTSANAGENLTFDRAKARFGWNAGGGVSTSWGPTELFVESRFFQVKSDLTFHQAGGIGTYTSFTPIVVGLQWF